MTIGESNYFLDKESFKEISRYTGLKLLDELNLIDKKIPMSMNMNNVSVLTLGMVFEKARNQENENPVHIKEIMFEHRFKIPSELEKRTLGSTRLRTGQNKFRIEFDKKTKDIKKTFL